MTPRLPIALAAALAACASEPPPPAPFDPQREQSVRPGINDDFTNPRLDVDAMVARFEAESREVFAKRSAIARAVGAQPGMTVADVGAGTGVFVDFLARDVGAGGVCYAVEIAPKFVAALAARATARNQPQVRAVLGTERDVTLPAGSCDVVFACDTYHHFQYPRATLGSIHRALKPGGTLCIVDFERIEGTSRQWLLDHVRCGRETVIEEVTAAGFDLVAVVPLGLEENYFLRFKKRG
jgi:predicted methyltransferase